MTPGSTIAQMAQDSGLTPDEKAAAISLAVNGSGGFAAEYTAFKRNQKIQLDVIKDAFNKSAGATLMKNINDVTELVKKKGDALNTGPAGSARLSIGVLRERAAEQRGMLQDIITDSAKLSVMFGVFQKAEAQITGIDNAAREETRRALATLDAQRQKSPQLLQRQQDEEDAIAATEKIVDDVDARRSTENARRAMNDYLQTGLATDKPVAAPARARFSRNMAKI